jgi:VWFA-related protein
MKTASIGVCILTFCAVSNAQAPQATETKPQATENSDAVFRSDTRLVEVHATVTMDGRLVTTLPQTAFAVYENDVKQDIKVFKREDAPVSLGLVIDNSASMLVRRAQVAEAALKLVRASNKEDEVFIMTFNDRPALVQEFTHDIGQLEKSLNRINSQGATAMRDAVSLAVEHLKRLGKNDKKVVLVVTDGEDNSSATEAEWVVRAARQQDILVYAIGLLTSETERSAAVAKRDLDALTMETGGEVFYPKALSEVDDIAEHVAQDLRNQYTIAYNPTNQAQDGTFRKIRVTVNLPGATVKTRTGYYAEPAGSSTGAASGRTKSD